MAMVARWDPSRDAQKFQEEMSRRFDGRRAVNSNERAGWTPSCDIYEDEEGISLRFDLAGVEANDVDIRFENEVLTLRGERKLEGAEKREHYRRLETSHGVFTRSFSLPGTIDAENIRAESKNGILTVFLPKKPEAKPRSIKINVG